MIYVTHIGEANGRARVKNRYTSPFPELEKIEPNGFYIESVPEPETPEGFNPVLMVKLPKKAEGGEGKPELYYDYVAIPEPTETQIQRLQKQVDVLSAQSATLANGQELHEDVITEIVMHVYE